MQKKSTRRMSFGLTMAVCCLCIAGNATAYDGGGKKSATIAATEKMSPLPGSRQNVTVTGKVVNEAGEGMPGVTVVLKGTTIGTSTDINGNFSLSVPQSGGTLVLSFIGYTTQEVALNGRTSINVTLQPDAQALQEVVVVGYGTQKKSDVTGSVTAITEEEFQQGNVVTPEQLIAGKVSGVQITSNSGAPGAGSTIRIRGGSSLNASNDPLIVIDGVPIDNAGISGSANALSLINPNDIASFNILKDASATAIYGSRASNGVIIITTKKAEAGQKFKVNFSSLASLSVNSNKVDVLSADEFREAVNQYASAVNRPLLGEANTDWQDLIYREAFSQDHNLSLSGSLANIPYRVSLGYLDQNGVLLNSNLKRGSAALTLNPSFLDDHLKVNMNVRGVVTHNTFADEGAIGAAVTFDPTQSPYQEGNPYGGYFEWANEEGQLNTLAPRNPLSLLNQRDDQSDVFRSIGNLQLDYKFHFLPDLRANLNVGYDKSIGEGEVVVLPTSASVFELGGSRTQYKQEKLNSLFDFYLNYTKEIASLSSRIDATAGYSYQKFNIQSPDFDELDYAGEPIPGREAGIDYEVTNVLLSFFGRVNYTLLDRYILTATLRRDASSRFNPDVRWGSFPALAFAWRIIEEPFMRNSGLFSDLKLRVGYGVTGQQDIGPYYPYLPRYAYSDNAASYQLGNQFYTTLRPAGYDYNIKWEETKTYNAGLDFGFLNNRITGTLDYYVKETEDLLAEIQVPAGSNLTNRIVTNVGSIENRGLEAALNFAAISKDNFTWDVSVNATYNENEITSLSKVPNEDFLGYPTGGIGGGVGNTIQLHSVGHPRSSFYVYKQVYNENGTPIEGLYADLSGDGQITDEDMYIYKNPDANVFLGFSSQVNYGNWDFGFTLRGSFGNYVYNNLKANAYYNNLDWPGYLLNIPSSVRDHNFLGVNDPNRQYSDYFIENASFVRMDNINLGYNFGRIINDTVNLRLTASGQNVFVITNYSGLDPEVGGGIDNSFYPRPRIFSLGLNLDF